MTGDSQIVRQDDGDSAGQSLDEIFVLLSSQHRRFTLPILADRAQPVAVADLAEDIAAREHEMSTDEVQKEDVQTVYTGLFHTHLPKLADAGAIKYDRDRNVVEVSETDSRVQRVLAFATNDGEIW